jgi:hypothetical protein
MAAKKKSASQKPYYGQKGMVQIHTPEGTRWEKEDYGKHRIGASGKGHPAVKVTKKKATRKRVAGK